MANENSLDLWSKLANDLNNIILSSGEIQINNNYIWQTYLHKMTNEDWKGLLAAMCELYSTHPKYIDLNAEKSLKQTIETVLRWEYHHNRCLDTKKHKKTAWRMMMTLREVWNRVNDIDIPNSDKSKVKSNFNTLFEIDTDIRSE